MGAHRLTSILGVPAAIAYSIYGKFAGPEAGGDAAGDEGQKQRHVDKVWTEKERKEFLNGDTWDEVLQFAIQDLNANFDVFTTKQPWSVREIAKKRKALLDDQAERAAKADSGAAEAPGDHPSPNSWGFPQPLHIPFTASSQVLAAVSPSLSLRLEAARRTWLT
eukprot:TRINITY_DN370_c0_g2_i6.p1 TRINITY_DN370_c0_g2~~TRINITY_DN370_c0_g2_i6.p1  ORF type:complete len:164 (+),score=24.92 TRINITY_DN370_c0_g2_i6:2-493(+)